MKKEVYSFKSLVESLKEFKNEVVAIVGYPEVGSPIRLQYYKGKFAIQHGFNLCANFQLHKISNQTAKLLLKKCGAMSFENIDFSDENKRNYFNYDNFVKSFK